MQHLALLLLLITSKVLGDASLSYGMHQVGDLAIAQLVDLGTIAYQILTNLWVDLGMVLELTFFLLYLVALSWMDLSYLLPVTASTYLLTALFAGLVLQETIAPIRWFGTLAIATGVGLVGLGEYRQRKMDQS